MSEEMSDQDLAAREDFQKMVRDQQKMAQESLQAVDAQYADIVAWWRKERANVFARAERDGIDIGRADLVAVVSFSIGNAHTPADLAMMLATKIVDREGN